MSRLAIPEEQRPLLNRIRKLPEDALTAFISALESSPKRLASIQGLSPEEADKLRDAVETLYSVRAYFHYTVPEFVSATAQALQEIEKFPPEEVPVLEERLKRLLNITSVSIAQRAESLKAEYEHIFSAVRILTDARPVYGTDLSKPPTAALIIHTLRISYLDETSRSREIYFAMDGGDIPLLRGVLDRAEAKSKSLESVFTTANIPVLNTDRLNSDKK